MIDIALAFNSERFDFDLVLDGDGADRDLQGDAGLLTAVIISLFTDRRANADDPLPDERVGVPSDSRGWWGDYIPEEDAPDLMGSRLWLLAREKDMDVVVARAQQYADEALQGLIRDGHVLRLQVTAVRAARGYLGISVSALEPAGGMNERTREWNFVYDYENAVPVRIKAPGL
jgi:phage gp46-like protein